MKERWDVVSMHQEALRKLGWRMKTIGGEAHWEDPRQPEVYHSMPSALADALVQAVRRLDESEARMGRGGSALEPTVVWRGSVSDFVTDLRPHLSLLQLVELADELVTRVKGYLPPIDLPSLNMVEDRTAEQLEEDGDDRCWVCGRLGCTDIRAEHT